MASKLHKDIKMNNPSAINGAAPAPLTFLDDFNRANENLDASPNWARIGGTSGSATIVSNMVNSNTSETCFLSPNLGAPNHYTEVTLKSVGSSGPFTCCRMTDLNNFVGVRASTTTYQLWKRVASVLTQLGSSLASIPAANDVLRCEAVGDTARALLNGVEVIAPMALSGDLAGITRQGVVPRTVARAPWIDDYKAGTL